MKCKTKVGEDIDLEVRIVDAKVRSVITVAAITGGTTFLLGAFFLGVAMDENLAKLQSTWSAVGPIFGMIGGYYFRSTPGK